MKTITCLKCGKEKIINEVCKNCGYKPKKGLNRPLLYFGLIVVISLFMYSITKDKPRNEREKVYTELDAYKFAEGFVENRLKAPKTAKFPPVSTKINHVTRTNKNEFFINSWVDSQNSFGVPIRTKFSCTIIFTEEKVKIENLKFLE